MKAASLRPIGNSQGFIVDRTLLDLIGVEDRNAVFEVTVKDGGLFFRPLSRKEQKQMIKMATEKVLEEQAPNFKKLAE